MNNQSIEFGKIGKDPDLPDNVRKSFRVPIEDAQKVWVMVNARRYAILDICFDGVRILIDNDSDFKIEQSLLDCELNLFNSLVDGLNGRVVHITLSETKELQCGIQWMDASEGKAVKIFDIVSKMKNQLLKGDIISFDSP